MPDFASALKIKTDKIERPPIAPTGHYGGTVTRFTMDTSPNGEWEIVNFFLRADEAGDDVDKDELRKIGGPKAVNVRHNFMFPTGTDDESVAGFKRTLWGLKRFLNEHLLIPEGGSLEETINNATGKKCIFQVIHKQSKDNPDDYFANVGGTAPLT